MDWFQFVFYGVTLMCLGVFFNEFLAKSQKRSQRPVNASGSVGEGNETYPPSLN